MRRTALGFAFFVILAIVSISYGQEWIEVHGPLEIFDDNNWVEARVDTNLGFFGIGAHLPLFAPFRTLTVEYENPTTMGNCNFILKIDGSSTYGLHANPFAFTPPTTYVLEPFHYPDFPKIVTSYNWIQDKWVIPVLGGDEITVNQYFEPDSIDSLGVIQVRYTITNNGTSSHTVALEHKWDININGVDDAPVAIPGMAGDTNAVYDVGLGDRMPGSFVAAELNLITEPYGLVARGIINGAEAAINPPDFFAFGDEYDLVLSNFSVDASFAGGTYVISGALLRWNDVTIPPGETWTIITYYGLGQISGITDDISVTRSSGRDWWPVDCRYDNPHTFQYSISNGSIGTTVFDSLWVHMSYDTFLATMLAVPPYALNLDTLFLDMGPGDFRDLTWAFDALEDTCGEFCYSLYCSTNVVGVAHVDTQYCWNIQCFSGIGPVAYLSYPTNPFTACTTGMGLYVSIVIDDTYPVSEGVDYIETITRLVVNGDTLIFDRSNIDEVTWSPGTDNEIETLTISLDSFPSLHYNSGDTIEFCVLHIEDIYGCSLDVAVCETIIVDTDPPIIWDIQPPPGSAVSSPTPTIRIGVIDLISGIDTTGLVFTVNALSLGIDSPGASWDDFTSTIIYDDVAGFPSETWVDVCLTDGCDLTDGICGPNCVEDSCWRFFVDYTAPRVTIVQPIEAEIVSCDSFTEDYPLIIEVQDSTCLEHIGTVIFSPGPTIDLSTWSDVLWDCHRIKIWGVPLEPGVMNITVSGLSDTLGNASSDIGVSFMVDTLGPDPNPFSIVPPDSSIVSIAFTTTIGVVEESGIDETTVEWHFWINGVPASPYTFPATNIVVNPGVGPTDYDFIFNNFGGTPLTLVDGDTLTLCLVNADDIANICPPNSLVGDSICWTYFIDGAGPRAELIWPFDSACTKCDPADGVEIQVQLTDPSGIDPSAVDFRVDGVSFPEYEIPDTDDTLDVYNIIVTFGYPLPRCPDPVEIELVRAVDDLGNESGGITWDFFIKDTPPTIDPASWEPYYGAPGTCITVSPAESIEFVIEEGCCGGIFHDSLHVQLRISGSGYVDIWGYDHPEYWFGDTFRIPISETGVEDADSIFINVAKLPDSLDYMLECGSNIAEDLMSLDGLTFDWGVLVSAGGPAIFRLQPMKRFVSCDSLTFKWRVSDDDGLNDTSMVITVWSETMPPAEYGWTDPEVGLSCGTDEVCCTLSFDLDLSAWAAVGETVCVQVTEFYDALSIRNEVANTWCVIYDDTPPCPDTLWPMNIGLSTRTPRAWAYVPGDVAPVLPESLAFSLDGGVTWLYQGVFPAVYWGASDTAICDFSMLPDSLLPSGGDTVRFCIRNTDNTDTLVGCPLNTCDPCTTFWIEANGPIPDAIEPMENWIVSCLTLDSLVIALNDSDAIVWDSAWATCTTRVSGDSWYWDNTSSEFDGTGHTLKIFPDPVFSVEDTYDVWIRAVDELMNPLAALDGIYHYRFIIDHTPPDSIWFTPNCYEDSVDSPIPTIWLHAEDEWGNVDSFSWCLDIFNNFDSVWVNICFDSVPGAWELHPDSVGLHTGLVPTLDPWWSGGDTILLHVSRVCDHSDMCPPNCTELMDTCEMLVPSQGPRVVNIWPDYNGILGCEQPDTFVFTLEDIEGVDTSTVEVRYWDCSAPDTFVYRIGDPEVIYYHIGVDNMDTLAFSPSIIVAEGCTMWVEIYAEDIFGNNAVGGLFPFVYDYSPPGFVIAYSPIDSVYSFTPEIPMLFPDNLAGVDTMSVYISLHSWCGPDVDSIHSPAPETLIWILDPITGEPETLIFSFDEFIHCMSTDSSACLTVYGACDDVAACPACTTFDTTWCFVVAQGGPQVDFYHPPSTGTLLCPEDSIVIDFIDPDGINTTDMEISVNGIVYPYPTPGVLFWDPVDERLAYYPSGPFTEDTIRVCAWGATDMLDYGMDLVCFTFDLDHDPPMPTYLGPFSPVSDPQPDIEIYLEDYFNAIIAGCFNLTVDGIDYPFDDSILTWTTDSGTALAGTLSWHAIAAAETLLVGDTIWVCLNEACDSTGCMDDNYLSDLVDTFCWGFEMSPGAGPIVDVINPTDCGMAISCSTSFQFIWEVTDSQGFADYSLQISYYDGVAVNVYDMDDPEVVFLGLGDTCITDTIILNLDPVVFDGWIWVVIDELDDVLGNPASGIGDTCFFLIDWDKPYPTDHWPGSAEVIAMAYPLCWWEVTDDSWKIDTTTGQVIVNSTRFPVSDPQVWWTGGDSISSFDTLWFLPSTPFAGGDVVTFCIDSVADSTVLCEPNWLDMFCDSFFINGDGPLVNLVFPDFSLYPNMVTFCDSGAFWVTTIDPEGLDSSSVYVVWNGSDTVYWLDTLTGLPTGYFELIPGPGDTDSVMIWPPFSMANGDTVCLHIPAAFWPDTLGNGLVADRDWCAVVDLSVPIMDAFYPAIAETVDTWTPVIYAHFMDSLAEVGHGCVQFEITENGVPWGAGTYTIDSSQISWSAFDDIDTVFFTPDTFFAEFAEICVSITICDSTSMVEPYNCPPNDTVYSWCFFIGDDDTIGPECVWVDSCYLFEGNDTFSILVGLADLDGVFDDASIDTTTGQGIIAHFILFGATGTTDYWVPMDIEDVTWDISVPGDSIYWAISEPGAIPADSLGAWDSLCFEIWSYDDDFDFDNPDDRQMAICGYHCCTIYDTIPPVIVAVETPEGVFTSCVGLDQAIVAGFIDGNDVIAESLYIVFYTSVYTVDSVDVDFVYGFEDSLWVGYPIDPDSAAGAIIYEPGADTGAWDNGDTIYLCVGGVYDIWFNHTNDSCWTYYADFLPPEAYCVEPADTNQDIEDFEEVQFELFDSLAGVDPSSITLTIIQQNDNGDSTLVEVPVYDPSMDYDSVSGILTVDLPYVPGLDLTRGDSLYFYITVWDLTEICDPNLFEGYLCVKYIKPITRCHASPQPFTPPPPIDNFNDEVFFDYPGRIDTDALIKVYDMRGRLVIEIGPGDAHSYIWDGYDFDGAACRPGVYTYVVEEGGEVICSGTVVLAR